MKTHYDYHKTDRSKVACGKFVDELSSTHITDNVALVDCKRCIGVIESNAWYIEEERNSSRVVKCPDCDKPIKKGEVWIDKGEDDEMICEECKDFALSEFPEESRYKKKDENDYSYKIMRLYRLANLLHKVESELAHDEHPPAVICALIAKKMIEGGGISNNNEAMSLAAKIYEVSEKLNGTF